MNWPADQSDTPFPAGSGHAAGYLWAQDRDIESEDQLPQRPGSFRDGAAAYLESKKAKPGEDVDSQ